MKTRKIVLSTLVAVLLCVYIVQLIVSSRSPIKTFELKASEADALDQITLVSSTNGAITLNKHGEDWTVSEQAYKTSESYIDDILESIKSVRTLGTVSRSASEETLQRFGLDNNTAITVTAFKAGEAVRTLYIGKAASTGDQTYLRLDGKNDIFLASGSLRDTFGRSEDSLRSKEVYALSSDELTTIDVHGKKSSFTAHRAIGENGEVWSIDGDENADSSKIASWAKQLLTMSAQSWALPDATMPAESESRIEFTVGAKRVSLTMAKIAGSKDAAEDGAASSTDDKYICSSSETPYLFYVTKTVADRLSKDSKDFEK